MNLRRMAEVMLATLALAAPAVAAPLAAHGVFVFSSLCFNPESGDPVGYRLKLTRGPKGDSALFEYGNGPLEGPLKVQHLSIQGLALRGWVDSDDGRIVLEGTIDDRSLALKALYPKPERMRPIRRLEQAVPECR
jgi:hypothetical protein